MQASGLTAKRVTAKQLAADLMGFWIRIQKGHEGAAFELFDELGLTITQVKTLHMLAHCSEELSVKELSTRLGLSLPATSRTVESMLKRGWVERREDDHDRRMKRVRITADGRAIAERVVRARMAGLEDFAASLTSQQRAELHAALSSID